MTPIPSPVVHIGWMNSGTAYLEHLTEADLSLLGPVVDSPPAEDASEYLRSHPELIEEALAPAGGARQGGRVRAPHVGGGTGAPPHECPRVRRRAAARVRCRSCPPLLHGRAPRLVHAGDERADLDPTPGSLAPSEVQRARRAATGGHARRRPGVGPSRHLPAARRPGAVPHRRVPRPLDRARGA